MAATQRLTRKERQAVTRASLTETAARLCAQRGLAGTSIEEIAAQAGYTKGAFYANFATKEDLFLTMLDEHFAERLREIDVALGASDDPEVMARRAGDDFARHVAADPIGQRLFLEFAAHASRDEAFREQLVSRYRTLRARIAELLRRRAEELGIQSPVPYDDLALMTFAMVNGFALERLLEPDVVPDDLGATMLELFFAGLGTRMEQP